MMILLLQWWLLQWWSVYIITISVPTLDNIVIAIDCAIDTTIIDCIVIMADIMTTRMTTAVRLDNLSTQPTATSSISQLTHILYLHSY